MTKKFIMAMIALSAVSFGAFAANDTNANTTPDKTEQCRQKCERKDRKARNPFEGLNLTEDQKTKLEALRASKQCCKSQTAKGNDVKQDDKCDRKQEYLNKVKEILTPEQYTQFLENHAKHGNKKHEGANKGNAGEKKCKKNCNSNKS